MAEYIEREALLEDFDAAVESDGMGYVIAQTLKRYVKRQTAADVAPVRHGRWIPVPSSDMATGKAYTCSECGKMRFGSFKPNYCPNCGARMDGAE